jgi:hypothetical protein
VAGSCCIWATGCGEAVNPGAPYLFLALPEIVWLWQEPERTSPKERGPTESLPGRNTETDRVYEGISEGCRPAGTGRVASRGERVMASCHTWERI